MNDRAKLINDDNNNKETKKDFTELSDEQQIQKSLRWMLNQQTFNIAITLTFNSVNVISPHKTRQLLREWDARINRNLFGTNWLKKKDQHIKYYAFLEKRSVNPHYHLVANIPEMEAIRLLRFRLKSKVIWSKLVIKGENKIQPIYDLDGWIRYITKELKYQGSYENMIISQEFKV